jgi:hypothetical protein
MLFLFKKSNRYKPDFVWSNNSWSYNCFRFYELIFGRKFGIKIESSTRVSLLDDGTQELQRHFYTVESLLVYTESLVRAYFKQWKLPKLEINSVYGSALLNLFGYQRQFVQGGGLINDFGYRFSIGFAAASSGNITKGTSLVFSQTNSGSDRLLLLGGTDNGINSWTATYPIGGSATAMTLLGSNASLGNRVFYQINPDTGANNITATRSGSGFIVCVATAYSGVKQTGFPDNSVVSSYNATPSTSISQAITPVADNCWAVLFGFWNANSGTVTAGANTTIRETEVNASGLNGVGDSNGPITPPASITLNLSGANTGRSFIILTIAPAGSSTTIKTIDGVTRANVKSFLGVNSANIKTINGIS